jgi:hypothetical protein
MTLRDAGKPRLHQVIFARKIGTLAPYRTRPLLKGLLPLVLEGRFTAFLRRMQATGANARDETI